MTDFEGRFKAHPMHAAQLAQAGDVRTQALELARLIVTTVPESREQSVALTSLEEVVFWAVAGIARHAGGQGVR